MTQLIVKKENIASALSESIRCAKNREDAAGYLQPSGYRQGLQDVLDKIMKEGVTELILT